MLQASGGKFAHICVDVDLRKPLILKIQILHKLQNVDYEALYLVHLKVKEAIGEGSKHRSMARNITFREIKHFKILLLWKLNRFLFLLQFLLYFRFKFLDSPTSFHKQLSTF